MAKMKKIRKWDEVTGNAVEEQIPESIDPIEDVGAWPSISRNHMCGIEDMVEQNDNSFDGVINNLPEPRPVCQVTAADVIEEEQKKKSVLKKLQEATPAPEKPKTVNGCVLCGDLERV